MDSNRIDWRHEKHVDDANLANGLNIRWIVLVLRIGLALAALTMLGIFVLSSRQTTSLGHIAAPHMLLTLVTLIAAAFLSMTEWFRRNWKVAILGSSLVVIGSTTWTYIDLGEQIPVFATSLVFLTATCALVPWEFRWQLSLTFGLLIATATDTLLVRVPDPYAGPLWLGLLASAAMSLAGNWLWAAWRDALAETNRKLEETNRKLEESEDSQRKLLDATLDPVSLIRTSDGRYIYVNPAFGKLGYAPEEVLGKSTAEFDVAELLEPENFQASILQNRFAQNFEANIHLADGRPVPYLISSVLVDLQGEQYLLSVARDITAMKQVQTDLIEAQQRLGHSEAKLRKIFEASPDAIAIISITDGRALEVNEACLGMGFSNEEFLGWDRKQRTIFTNFSDREAFVRRLLSEKTVRNVELNLKLKDGRIAPYLVSAVVAEFAGEQCMIAFAREISDIKRTQDELIAAREKALAASRAKTEFLSSMSHEIRTPMNAILGMADLLGEGELSAEQRRFLSTMISNGNALLTLINGILDLARIESGRFKLEHTEFDLEELVDHVAETLSVRAHEKGLELTARMSVYVPRRVVGDALRLRQVLINLVGNAIKFTEQGEVAIVIEALSNGHAGQLLFSVRDTGIGIAANQVDTVFQSFTQVDSSATRKYGGTGLGLSIASRLVEMMNGRLRVTSELDKGSTFSFNADLPAAAVPAPPCYLLPELNGAKVLVVDGNEASRLVVKDMLRQSNMNVDLAAGAEQALTLAKRADSEGHPYRLVLLSFRLPTADGLLTRSQLRVYCRAPVILLLTSEDLSRCREAIMAEGHAYVIKPVKRTELMRTIASTMDVPGAATAGMPTYSATVDVNLDERPLKILLVEDSPDNRTLINAYLKSLPFTVDEAENGLVAVTKFMRNRYDLVLMDVQMPVMDGYTAVRKIREWEQDQGRMSTPIAALTASATEEDVQRSDKAGCTAHISKPIKKAHLIRIVRELTAPTGPATFNEGKQERDENQDVLVDRREAHSATTAELKILPL